MSNSAQISVVLVEPHFGGNIGSTARAMKTMGLSRLVLVAPKEYDQKAATMMAASAVDVLHSATRVATLEQALAEISLSIAISNRNRQLEWPILDVEQAAERCLERSQTADVALVFGPEPMGLSNAHLQLCQLQSKIPSHPDCPSLNLAQAVQVYTYALYRRQHTVLNQADRAVYPPQKSVQAFYQLLDDVVRQQQFSHFSEEKVLQQLQKIFNKADLEQKELNLLHGLFSSLRR